MTQAAWRYASATTHETVSASGISTFLVGRWMHAAWLSIWLIQTTRLEGSKLAEAGSKLRFAKGGSTKQRPKR